MAWWTKSGSYHSPTILIQNPEVGYGANQAGVVDYNSIAFFNNTGWEKRFIQMNPDDSSSVVVSNEYYVKDKHSTKTMGANEVNFTSTQTSHYNDRNGTNTDNYYASRIIGNDKDNVIHGADYLYRHDDQKKIGSSGGGTGFDWADQIFGGKGNDEIYGYAGDDLLDGGEGNDTINGGIGNDQMSGGLGNDSIIAGTGNDIAYGGAGHDVIHGYGGDDTVYGGSGNDTLYGNEGNDFVNGDAGNDSIHGATGNDLIDGGAGHDVLRGDDGSDTLTGGSGNDTLYGGSGNDVVDAGTGYDVLYGGAGQDVFKFANVSGETGVDWIKDYQVGVDMIDLNGAVIESIGKATIWGDPYSVAINLGHMKYLIVEGVSDANDLNFVHYGDSADNRMFATDGKNNVIRSGLGNDTISGGAGNDVIDGGDGSDTASYADVTSGSLELDMMSLYSSGKAYDGVTIRDGYSLANVRGNTSWSDQIVNIENIIGTNSNDVIKGDANANRFEGGAGNDVLDGRGGNDVLVGGTGTDTFYGGAGADTFIINGGTGNKVMDFNFAEGDQLQIDQSIYNGSLTYAKSGSTVTVHEVKDGARNTILTMENLDANTMRDFDRWFLSNAIRGDANANRIEGTAGNDALNGGGGNDVLVGGTGSDTYYGGTGADTFVINGGTDNKVFDFNYAEGDQLQIDRTVYSDRLAYSKSGSWVQVYEVKDRVYNTILTMENLDANTMQNFDNWFSVA